MILDIIKSPVQVKAEYWYSIIDKKLDKVLFQQYDTWSIINNLDKEVRMYNAYIDFKFGSQWYQLYYHTSNKAIKLFKVVE